MSADVPYIAPWQTGFERFATQIYKPAKVSPNALQMQIPEGQWWRIIYIQATYSTNGIGTARIVELVVNDNAGQLVTEFGSPAAHGVSQAITYTWGPTLNAFVNAPVSGFGAATTPVPDVLWPHGDVLRLQALGGQAADSWQTPWAFAVEVYTENYDGALVPAAPTPTPLIA